MSVDECDTSGGARPKIRHSNNSVNHSYNGNNDNYGRNGLRDFRNGFNGHHGYVDENGNNGLDVNHGSNVSNGNNGFNPSFNGHNASSSLSQPNNVITNNTHCCNSQLDVEVVQPQVEVGGLMRADLPKSFFSSPDVDRTAVEVNGGHEENSDNDDHNDNNGANDNNEFKDKDDQSKRDCVENALGESLISVSAQQASSYEDPVLPRVLNWATNEYQCNSLDKRGHLGSRPIDLLTSATTTTTTRRTAATSAVSGQASVPAVTPCHDDDLTMVRSISLNGGLALNVAKEINVCNNDAKKIGESGSLARCRRFQGRLHRRTMLWSPLEASRIALNSSTFNSGATAVINVLKALKIDVDSDQAQKVLPDSHCCSKNASLFAYLWSRHTGDSTQVDVAEAVSKLSQGRVEARFFATHRRRGLRLNKWLIRWLERGVVPVVTTNPQVMLNEAENWRHQMVYGASAYFEEDKKECSDEIDCEMDSKKEDDEELVVYATNPLQELSLSYLNSVLCSDSILRVRVEDLVHRDVADLRQLQNLSERRESKWDELNVLGQVVSALRSHNEETKDDSSDIKRSLGHIVVPSSCKAGITLFVRTDSPWLESVRKAPELRLEMNRSDS